MATESVLGTAAGSALKPEADAVTTLDRYHRGPRACSSVDRASASGAGPLERSATRVGPEAKRGVVYALRGAVSPGRPFGITNLPPFRAHFKPNVVQWRLVQSKQPGSSDLVEGLLWLR